MSAKRSIYYLNDWSYKMMFQVRGIYTREETIFFCPAYNSIPSSVYRLASVL